MNIQNIQSISQNVDKTYGMLNELGSNGLELLDLAFPNHDGVQDEKAAGELMYLRQSVNSLKNACELAINELNDAIQDSLEYEIIKTGYRYIDNEDGTYDVCYDHAQDSYFSEINKHHAARVRDDENTYYIIGEGDSCEGVYPKKDWTFADALKNQCIEGQQLQSIDTHVENYKNNHGHKTKKPPLPHSVGRLLLIGCRRFRATFL